MEFHENMRFMKSLPLEPVGDVLVIAGDVGYLVDTTIPHLRYWKWASENYRQVLMIAGNHEYYNNGDIAAQGESWQKMYMPNVGSFRKISTMNSSETSRSSKKAVADSDAEKNSRCHSPPPNIRSYRRPA